MRDSKRTTARRGRLDFVGFLMRALALIAILMLVFLAWQIRAALLLLFVSVIVAALLSVIAEPFERHAKVPHLGALSLAALLLAGLIVGLFWTMGAQMQSQVADLAQQLPVALRLLEANIGLQVFPSADEAMQAGQSGIPSLQTLVSYAASFGTGLAGIISSLIFVLVTGFYLAIEPGVYKRGLVKLFPVGEQPRIAETLDDCARALRLWLIATFFSMLVIGVLVAVGTWLIGLPSPLALGLFAFLVEFIPVVGSIFSAAPGLLLALNQGTMTFLWAAAVYLVVQQLESNVVTPVIQRRMVKIPPVLLLFAITAMGLLFGFLGILIAAPLTVVVFVAVKKLYVREALGQETNVPGEVVKNE